MMDEAEFQQVAERFMEALVIGIESAAEAAGADVDVDMQTGGVLQLGFEDGSQIIINRHLAAREIWVAARTGGFHFALLTDGWFGTRDGRELLSVLSELISRQAGAQITLRP